MYASRLVTLVNEHHRGQPTIRSLGRRYWSVQGYALAQAALTGTGSLILAGDWLRCGLRVTGSNS